MMSPAEDLEQRANFYAETRDTMSIWSDDPEYFDGWIEKQAMNGRFGEEIRVKVENGDLAGYEIWAMKDIDPKGDLGSQATEDYCHRFAREEL